MATAAETPLNEDGVRRKRVRKREVGCQSDSAETRDAGVQVDLLIQQIGWTHPGGSAVPWQCVSLTPDEPGEDAALPNLQDVKVQLCSSHLPMRPQEPGSAPQSSPLTSILCSISFSATVGGAAPPGLIAPLSPRLAEEEEEEEKNKKKRKKKKEKEKEREKKNEKKTKKKNEEEKEKKKKKEKKKEKEEEEPQRPRRMRVGPTIRYLLESEEVSHGLSAANHSRVSIAMVKKRRTEHEEEEEERMDTPRERTESPEDGGVDTCERHLSVHRGQSQREEELEEEAEQEETTPLPPAPTEASDWMVNVKDVCTKKRRRPQEKCGGRKRRKCRDEEGGGEEREEKDEEEKEEKGKGRDVKEDKKEKEKEEKNEEEEKRKEDKEEEKRKEENEEEEKGKGRDVREDKEEEKEQRPRRTRVGPPIRYLLESEEASHGSVITETTNQDAETKQSAGGPTNSEAAAIEEVSQTGVFERTYLIHKDLQSHQETIIAPCWVTL